MVFALVHVSEDGRQQEVPLKKAVHVLGRQTDCAIRIPSSSVSRHHCEIAVTDDSISIRDLGSSNGTYVNQRRVQQSELSAGDLLAVGEMVFVVRIDGKPGEIDAEDAYDDGVVLPTVPTLRTPASPEAFTRQSTTGSAKPAAPGPGGKGPLKSLVDEEDQVDLKPASPADSSVGDFDFLDEDDDLKKQPKL